MSESSPGEIKGGGEVDEMTIGPYGLKECKLTAKSKVKQERSKTLFTELSIRCETVSHPEKDHHIEEHKKVHFKLGLLFNANKSAEAGQGEAGLEITKTVAVPVSIGSSKCKLEIPNQFLPAKSGTVENHEYESAEYETEEEEVEGKAKLKKYPSGFKKTLDIFWELKRIKTLLVTSSKCTYNENFGPGEEEGKLNGEGKVEYTNGKFEGELEELELKGGSLWFDEEEPEV